MARKFSVQVLSVVSMFLMVLSLAAQVPSTLPSVIDEHQLLTLKGNTPHQARAQYDRGEVSDNLPMNRMVLLLKRSDAQEADLQATIRAMHDSRSPQYHQWLTPQQFGSLYGPSDADISTVTQWLQSHGFHVDAVSNGRVSIEFSGSASQVKGAFHTTVHTYAVAGKQYIANASDPSIPQALSPVVSGILSLNNHQKGVNARLLGKGQIVTGPDGKSQLKPDLNLTSGAHAVAPGDLWTIYNATPLITAASNPVNGTGQTIAIVGRSDVSSSDISGFRKHFLPAPYASTLPFKQIDNGPDPGVTGEDALEQTLDVEYASAMAPAAQVDLVVSASTNTTDGVDLSALYIVDNNLASVMSTSYGLCEADTGVAGNAFYNALWQQAAAQGITSMVSAGDNGSASCDRVGPSGDEAVSNEADEGLQVNGVASTPYNVAVGGSEFTDDSTTYWSPSSLSSPAPLTSALSYIPEMVWNESCSPLTCGNALSNIAAGSGGKSGCLSATFDLSGNITACSGGYPEPDWQAGVAGLPADGARHLPDVSLTAAGHDGYALCYQGSCNSGGIYIVGGTSGSSPSFAGIMALVNQKTGSRQGQANYTLYRLAAGEFGSASAPNAANLASCNATAGNKIGSSCIFNDVTTGTNAVPCDGGTPNCSSTTVGVLGVLTGYAATAGYDNATGLGSVNVANLVKHWNDTTLTPTSTTLSLGSTTSTFGQPVNIAVKVASTSGSGTPTGSIALTTDAATASGVGAFTLASGAYSGTISSLPGGTYNVSARYAGDTSFSASTSSSSKITINPAGSSALLAFTATDAVTGAPVTAKTVPYGSLITATATLTGATGQVAPTGTVLFKNGSTTLSTQSTNPTGVANYTSGGYAIGTYTWTASYGGNANYTSSLSPVASFTVGQATPILRLLSSTSYVVGANTAKLTALVLTDSLLSNPTGSIVFSVNGTPVNTATVAAYHDPSTGSSEAIATFTLSASALTAGANTITAAYSGDGNYLKANSAAVSIGYSATAPANTITLTTSSSSLTLAQPVTITATVKTGGIPATAGTVNFFDGTTLLASAQVVGSSPAKNFVTGNASFATLLSPGTHNLKAIYAGILSAPTPVTSAVIAVTVTGKEVTIPSLSAAINATVPSQYDLTATVTGYGLLAPTGTIDFAETSVVQDLGSVSLDPKTALQTFLSPTFVSTGDPGDGTPSQSVIADFNGDGIPDLATANASFNSSSMSVLIGNGDGTYKTPVVYNAGTFAVTIATGDFNGDGILDIAVTNQYDSTFSNGFVSIYLGNGDGTFQPQLAAKIPGHPVGTVVADFNRDGILDLASLQYYPMQISVEFGNGDGTFSAPVNYPVGYNDYSSYLIASGDFNGDGAPDLVEVNSQDKSAEVFLNAGDGTFQLSVNLTTGSGPQWVSVADVNSDGKQDVIVSNYNDNTLGVFLGKGDGTFQSQVTYPVDGYANSITVADVDGDGKLDLVAPYFTNIKPASSAMIGILKGNGDGTFAPVKDIFSGQGHATNVAIADLDGNGTLDLVNTDINDGDPASHDIATLLNVTQTLAVRRAVSLAGPVNTKQEVIATYSGDTNYNTSSSAGIFLNSFGVTATPVLLWTPASPWGVGVPLGVNVLNATTSGIIPGVITYTAQLGTSAAVAVTATSTLGTAGTYTITATFKPVDGNSYRTVSATRSVSIIPADFSLEGSVPSLTIASGKSGTLSVNAAALFGFTGQIALGSGSLPGGFSVTASPATVAANGSSTITITTSALDPAFVGQVRSPSWKVWTSAGITLCCLLMLPLVRRRRLLLQHGLVLFLCFSALNLIVGCGEGYSNSSSMVLTTSSPSAASGSPVTLTAKLGGSHSSFSGTVTFYNGTTILGSPVAVSGNTATLNTSSLPVGLNIITATYTGDEHNAGGNSHAIQQLITGTTSVQLTGTSGSISHSTTVQVVLQ